MSSQTVKLQIICIGLCRLLFKQVDYLVTLFNLTFFGEEGVSKFRLLLKISIDVHGKIKKRRKITSFNNVSSQEHASTKHVT